MEKVCGLSRVVKANAQVAFDNVALWHERDISHSSAERVAQADSFIALDHMFQCLIRIVDGLQLYPAQMLANLNKTRGLDLLVQGPSAPGRHGHHPRGGLQDRAGERHGDLARRSSSATPTAPRSAQSSRRIPRCSHLTKEELDKIFDPWSFLGRIGVVFDRLEQLSFD